MTESIDRLEAWAKITQIISVLIGVLATVIGVVISVQNLKDARSKELEARKIEAARPFLQMRQERYADAVNAAAIVVNHPDERDTPKVKEALERFQALYVAELSMVENSDVQGAMVNLMKAIDPTWKGFSEQQLAAYNLSHSIRNSLVKSWGIDEKIVDVSQ